MELAKLILPMKTVEFEYPGVEGLKFKLSYLSKKELTRMRKSHLKLIKNKISKQFVEELDEDGFMNEYVPSVIKDWSGLNLGNIQEFVIVGDSEDPSKGVPYSPENAYELLTNSQDLDTWVSEMISEIENFRNQDSKKNEES